MTKKFIVLDTEGVDTQKLPDGKPNPSTGLFYDLGYIVADKSGNVYEKRSFANSDVIFNQELMSTSYYANKLPQYLENLNQDNGWTVADTLTIFRQFRQDVSEYEIKEIWAYNCKYDKAITNSTVKQLSHGFACFFTPYRTKWRDIWDVAGSTICNTKKYVRWCIKNGFVSSKGNPSTSADTVGKYILNDLTFKERHTALSDCEIELSILLAALRRKQKTRKTCGHGWRDAAAIAKKL